MLLSFEEEKEEIEDEEEEEERKVEESVCKWLALAVCWPK